MCRQVLGRTVELPYTLSLPHGPLMWLELGGPLWHNPISVQTLDPKTGRFEEKPWQHVVVGEILRTKKDEAFAADVLLLGGCS